MKEQQPMLEGHDQVTIELVNDVLALKLTGQFLGGEETEFVRNELMSTGVDIRGAIIDMSGVTFANSSFLGTILAIHTAYVRKDSVLLIAGLQKTVAQIFKMTRLDNALNVFSTFEEALKSLIQRPTKR